MKERTRSSLLLPLGAFLIVGVLLLPFYRYELGPDAISYLSIAAQYINGYWKEAINAYWGPLYSWSIGALLMIHVPGILAARLVALGAGVLTLLGLHRMSLCFDMAERFRRAFLWVSAAIVLAFVMEANSPDLLFTAVLLLYLGIIFDPAYPSSRLSGVLCGALGGLAYFAKAYGFFFFAAHFLVFSAIYWITRNSPTERRRIGLHFLAGVAIFCALSSAWIVILHAKYGRWMLGTTGDFNARLVGPESAGYPHFRHLIAPGSDHAITAWQDPSPSWLPAWSALASRPNLKHQAKLVEENAKAIFAFLTNTTPLFTAFLLGYVVLCLDSSTRRAEWIYPVLTIALFSSGYLLISVRDRYLWPADLLLLWIAFRTLDLLFRNRPFTQSARVLLVAGVVLSFLINPVLVLHAHFLADRNVYQWSQNIKHSVAIRGSLASCADWQDSAYLAYILGVPYYGVPVSVPEADEVARDLNPDYRPLARADADRNRIPQMLSAARVDYFVMWPSCAPIPADAAKTVASAGDIQLLQLNPQSPGLTQ